jgi:hypothetical protein
MLDDMSSTSCESSVIFNLRQLMELEQEREAAERVAHAQAERERSVRERAEAERVQQLMAAEAEREREQAAAEAERIRIAREAALLRVQLDAEAAERARRDPRAELHARELAELIATSRRRQIRVVMCAFAALSLCGALVLGEVQRVQQRASDADSRQRAALALASARERELAELHTQIERIAAPSTAGTQVMQSAPKPASPTREPRLQNHPHHVDTKPPAHDPTSLLPELDLNSDDPLEGLTPKKPAMRASSSAQR